MVLLIGDQTFDHQISLDQLGSDEDLVKFANDLCRSKEVVQPTEEFERTLYVAQREFAVVAQNDKNGFCWIGTDDATTCHILILDNRSSVALGHLDGCETEQSIENICLELDRYSIDGEPIDLYLVGGFDDRNEKNLSIPLSGEILTTLCRMKNRRFRVRLAAVSLRNDKIVEGIHFPIVYGVCFDIERKTLRSMSFIDKGPSFILRCLGCSMVSEPATCLYSSINGQIIIKQFVINQNTLQRFYLPLAKYYFQNNKKLLELTSTSPVQEKPSYIINMKKTILFALKYHQIIPDWFDKNTRSIIYERLGNQWKTKNSSIIEEIEIDA